MSIELSERLQSNLRSAHAELSIRGGGGRLEVEGDEHEGKVSVIRYPLSESENAGGWIVSGPLGGRIIDFLATIQ